MNSTEQSSSELSRAQASVERRGPSEQSRVTQPTKRPFRWSMIEPYLYLLPAMAILCTFIVLPVLYAFYLSLTDWDLISPKINFVGLQNYADLLTDRTFWRAFWHTVTFALGTVPTQMAIALTVAVILNTKLRLGGLFRSLFFLPAVVPITVVATVWLFIFSPTAGIFNYLLGLVGLPALGWFNDPTWALIAIMMMSIWKNFGFHAVIFLAGLKAIPPELAEAAAVDGASRWRIFWSITFPLLMPTTFLSLILSTIGSFKAYEAVVLTTGGGPAGSTNLLVFELYRTAFEYFNMGYAAAMAYFLFAILFALTLLQFKFIGSRVHYL